MAYSTLGQILIIFLLMLNSARFFFIKNEKQDTLSLLSPITLLLSILYIFSWKLDFFSISMLLLSLLSLIINIHALFRLALKLYIDHFSVTFMIGSTIILLLCTALAFFAIVYSPVKIDYAKHNAKEYSVRLSGSFDTGFHKAKQFEKSSAELLVIEPESNAEQKKIIILVPDKRADAFHYKPYMTLLAQKGYTVLACDFFSKEANYFSNNFINSKIARRFFMLLHSIYQKEEFLKQQKNFTYIILRECNAIASFAKKTYGENVSLFFVADEMSEEAVKSINFSRFSINQINEYSKPGLGFIEQTDPLLAKYFKIKKDKTLFLPRYLSLLTIQKITTAQNNTTSQNTKTEGQDESF